MHRLLAACAVALLLGAATPPADKVVHYRLTPELGPDGLKDLAVEIRLTGDADGSTRLHLPDEWASAHELWRQVRDVQVEGASLAEDGPAYRVLTHAPGAAITIRYRVVTAFDRDPAVGATVGNPYQPILRPAWFSVIGHAVFASPDGEQSRPADFRWGTLPSGWTVASDLDHGARGRRLMVGDIEHSTAVGAPDLRLIASRAAGADLRLAVLGRWSLDVDAFATLLTRVVEAEHAYWGDRGEPFIVTMTPLVPAPGSTSLGGTGLDDAFAVFASSDSPLPLMRYLLAHEHMHTWNSSRLGGVRYGPDQPADYWFSEGFTDFLTQRVLLRSGVWSLEDYATELNQVLTAYALSPVRTAPNARIVADFWKDPQVQKLPYQRGLLLAMVWDDRLRRSSHGRRDLDDVFKAQLALARGIDQSRPGHPTAPDLFTAAWRRIGGPDLADDLRRLVGEGEDVRLPADLFGSCATIRTEQVPVFDRGFDLAATTKAGNVFVGVRSDSPAYAAGLRDGMKIKGREAGKPGDSRVEYVYRVDDQGVERVIRFLPQGKDTVTLQSVVLAASMTPAVRAACTKRMAGL